MKEDLDLPRQLQGQPWVFLIVTMVTYVAGLTCSKADRVPRLRDRKLPLAEQLELKKILLPFLEVPQTSVHR